MLLFNSSKGKLFFLKPRPAYIDSINLSAQPQCLANHLKDATLFREELLETAEFLQ